MILRTSVALFIDGSTLGLPLVCVIITLHWYFPVDPVSAGVNISILLYGTDCNMSTIVIRLLEPLVSCCPSDSVHTLVTAIPVFTPLVSSVTEQVRLTAVPSYRVSVEGLMARVSWGVGTDTRHR